MQGDMARSSRDEAAKWPLMAASGFLWRVLKLQASAQSEDDFLSEAAWLLCAGTGADGCDILLANEGGGLSLKASTYAPEYVHRCKLGPGVGLSGHVFTTGEAEFMRSNGFRHPKNVDYPGMEARTLEGVAAVPMSAAGVRVGACLLHRETPWPFTRPERTRIEEMVELVTQCHAAFLNAFSHGARSTRLGALSEVSRNISATPYLEEILQLLVNITAQQFQYRVVAVRLLDEQRGELVLRATQAPAKAYQKKRAIKLGESIAGRAIRENRPVIVPDVQEEPDYIGHDLAVEQGLRSMICAPLMLGDRAIGVMSCYTSEVRAFPPDEVAALETLAKQAAIAIEHAKLQVRTTLLQEVHHRVKNNLQQVASLLRLQMRHGEYKSLEQALSDSLSRILAIAAVHDLLSREDLDHVGLKTLAEALIQHQRDSLILPDRTIEFQIRGQDVHLNTTQATQVALILNELIQNAVEHGFLKSRRGEVHVTVEESDREVALWVSNNGDSLPEGFDVAKEGRLGVTIVDSLARALGGRFKLTNELGWAVAEVKFTRTGGE
jgi:two-component sensor histidine kinase